MNLLFYPILTILFSMCISNPMHTAPGAGLDLSVPAGFHVDLFADEIKNARAMTLGTDGTVFVGSRSEGTVYALRDSDLDGKADERYIIDRGLKMPVGVAFHDGDLYVSAVSEIYRYDAILPNLSNPPSRVLVSGAFPKETHHGWKFIDFGPDGKLYVPVGAPCNICEEDPDVFSNIMRMDKDGSNLEVYARGVRNTVGFAWHPTTGELWFTENGRDWMGDDMPPCELNRAPEKGMHFGYPYCHGGTIADPEFGSKRNCSEFEQPAWNFDAHTAPLGMCFYTGDQFPETYKHTAFVALHGSWNRSTKIGYEVLMLQFSGTDRVIKATPFLTGFLKGGKVSGRPVDVLQLPDGSILVSDDRANRIYRVTYTG